MNSVIKLLAHTSILKTLRVNFHYLKFRDAIKLPILISRATRLRILNGDVRFNCPIHTGIIRFGYDTLGLVDYGRQRAIWENNGSVVFNGRASFGAASRLVVIGGGKVIVGQRFAITGRSSVISEKSIIFGDNCLISWDVQIMDTDFHSIFDEHNVRVNPPKEIKIGSHVWIGSNCHILKGSVIPDNCVIASNSNIHRSYNESNAIYGGNPIRILRQNITWQQ